MKKLQNMTIDELKYQYNLLCFGKMIYGVNTDIKRKELLDEIARKTKKKIESLVYSYGWDVCIEDETEDYICYDFSKRSPAGKDFHIYAELENMSIETLVNNLMSEYTSFDCSYETYLWIDNTGHGKNGAPYDMKDVYKDMEACQEMIKELYMSFKEAFML